MDRREFLGVSMAAAALLIVGEATQTKAMAQGIGRISEAEQATIWFLTDNYYDANRADTKITKRYRSLPGKSMHAEHGLSFYIQTVVDGKASVCMFDYGLDPSGVINNAALLGLDLAKPNAFGLSHGHYDHFTGP
jgi:7,8-dihydropterin-6-yl-methyl-4-(beta-D-ribofuranosyl)aminobenzene 5'-phosphate synthase